MIIKCVSPIFAGIKLIMEKGGVARRRVPQPIFSIFVGPLHWGPSHYLKNLFVVVKNLSKAKYINKLF